VNIAVEHAADRGAALGAERHAPPATDFIDREIVPPRDPL
jgi:hypothetical protein